MSYGPANHAGDHTRPSGGNASCTGRGGARKAHKVAIDVRNSNTRSASTGTTSGLMHSPSEQPPMSLGRTMPQGTNVG